MPAKAANGSTPSTPKRASTKAVGTNGSGSGNGQLSTRAAKPNGGAVDLSRDALGSDIRISGRHFVDAAGRVLLMHGMNVSSMSKL